MVGTTSTYDGDGNRLFITRGTHVMVVDAKTLEAHRATFPTCPGFTAWRSRPSSARGFISNGGDNMLVIFDLKTLKVSTT